MRILLNGQKVFGRACLEAISGRGVDDIVAVVTAQDTDEGPDPVALAAAELGIPVMKPTDLGSQAVLDEIRALRPDVMVLAYTTIFVPAIARDLPTHGTICFHPSLLPRHRGPSSINWPIIWGETRTGLTVFWPSDGLDEGDILLQRTVDIGPDDTLGTVYFSRIFPLGVEAVLDSLDLIRRGEAPRVPQDEKQATYEGWCRAADAEVDWWRSAAEVHNLIRGTDPQPGAWTVWQGRTLQLFDAARVAARGRPGDIVGATEEGITIVAGGGGIRIGRVRLDGGQKVAAGAFAMEAGLLPGGRLGRPRSPSTRT